MHPVLADILRWIKNDWKLKISQRQSKFTFLHFFFSVEIPNKRGIRGKKAESNDANQRFSNWAVSFGDPFGFISSKSIINAPWWKARFLPKLDAPANNAYLKKKIKKRRLNNENHSKIKSEKRAI